MLSVISIVALALYFVTSSDSGSYVVDMISANGHHDPPVIQRIFWSFTEGATACALLAAGRNLPNSQGSLRALQAVSILMGLPYTFVLFWCSQALLLLVKEESGELAIDRKGFSSFLFTPPATKCVRLVINTALPGVTMGKAAAAVGGWPMSGFGKQAVERCWGVVFQGMYLVAAVFVLMAAALYQWCIIGLVVYIGFGTFLGLLRTGVRRKYQIQHGDIFTDLLCAIFAPMFTLVQLESALEENGALDNGGKEEAAPPTV